MENDIKNNRQERLGALFIQITNNLRPFTEEQQKILDQHTVVFDLAPLLDVMKNTQESLNILMKGFSVMGSMLYDLTLHDVQHKINDSDFEQFMKDMGETKCH